MADFLEAFEIEPSYDHEDPFGPGPRILWGRIAALAGLVVFAFLIGHLTGGGGSSGNTASLQSTIQADNSKISQLEAALQNASTGTGAGATPTPAATASTPVIAVTPSAPSTTPTLGPNGTSYTVQAGDSLSKIEETFYHTIGLQYTNLLEQANGLTSATIHTGEVLTIPPASALNTVTSTPAASPSAVPTPHVTSTKK